MLQGLSERRDDSIVLLSYLFCKSKQYNLRVFYLASAFQFYLVLDRMQFKKKILIKEESYSYISSSVIISNLFKVMWLQLALYQMSIRKKKVLDSRPFCGIQVPCTPIFTTVFLLFPEWNENKWLVTRLLMFLFISHHFW